MFHALDKLVEGEVRAVEEDRVRGWAHRGQIALSVAAVTHFLCAEHLLQVYLMAAGGQLLLTPFGPLNWVGDEEEFTRGLGKDNRPLVPALADDVQAGGEGPLPFDELLPDDPAVGNLAGGGGHLWGPDGKGDVLAVE